MPELPVMYYGAPVLRKKAEPVTEITEEIRQFVADMIDTSDAKNGVGLAATQVNRSLRIFIIRLYDLDEEEKVVWKSDYRVFINPKLSEPAQETDVLPEGCLSVPDIYGEVERPLSIRVESMNLEGEVTEEVFSGYIARQIMHENDHLNGVLFVDRMSVQERKEIESQLRALKKMSR